MENSNLGRFAWYDLLTNDTKAAEAFYTQVVGWKTQPWEDGEYTMWAASQGPLGGVMKPRAAGTAPQWRSYVTVAHADAIVEGARKHNGRVLVEPTEIPKVGRFAVIADPQGATIGIIESSDMGPLHDPNKPGEFCWSELMTTDHEAAFRFYSALFGWERIRDFDMGAMGKYLIYGKGGQELGGMFTKLKDMPMQPAWLYYAQVTDLDAAVRRAEANGGKLCNGPMEVPGGARIAQLSDPQGAAFALHANK